MVLEKDEQLLSNRLKELARIAYNRNLCSYTHFLNLNEQSILNSMKAELPAVQIMECGGYEFAERKMFCFYTEDSYMKPEFPMDVLEITVAHEKYSDKLSHRDYLGAILNLGIDRSKVGDILVDFPSTYVFCHKDVSDYVVSLLSKIKHTQVNCSIVNKDTFEICPKFEEIRGSVSSVRIDAILSIAFKSSRSSLCGLIEGEKVFVNGRIIHSNSYALKEGDVVSVRGYGKFIFKEVQNQSKKGRTFVLIHKFI